MLSLAIDTATAWGRFALARDGELLAYRPHNVTGSYADALLGVIGSLLDDCGCVLADVDALGICRGPGSFTGLRIGVAMAKALAWSIDRPLFAPSTLAAMASAMLADRPDSELAVPVLDARRGEIFAGVYARSDGWVEAVAPAAARAADDWWTRILELVPDPESPAYAGNGSALLLGEGADLRPELDAGGPPRRRAWSTAHPATARDLAVAVSVGASGLSPTPPFALTPLYLRASEAEVKRGLDLTPSEPGEEIESRRPGSGSEDGP